MKKEPFGAGAHEPLALKIMKRPVAQAFQPVLGHPGAGVLHNLRKFSKQL
jgi:hypothetical protein